MTPKPNDSSSMCLRCSAADALSAVRQYGAFLGAPTRVNTDGSVVITGRSSGLGLMAVSGGTVQYIGHAVDKRHGSLVHVTTEGNISNKVDGTGQVLFPSGDWEMQRILYGTRAWAPSSTSSSPQQRTFHNNHL